MTAIGSGDAKADTNSKLSLAGHPAPHPVDGGLDHRFVTGHPPRGEGGRREPPKSTVIRWIQCQQRQVEHVLTGPGCTRVRHPERTTAQYLLARPVTRGAQVPILVGSTDPRPHALVHRMRVRPSYRQMQLTQQVVLDQSEVGDLRPGGGRSGIAESPPHQ